jgi:hypothetical protein
MKLVTQPMGFVLSTLILGVALLLPACSSKLEKEYDFRPYLVSWANKNCGANKTYNCSISEGFADDGFDGEDYVYGLYYVDKDSRKRIVFVKIAAAKPHEAAVVGDEPAPER